MYRSIATALLALMGFAGSAHAVPVQWTLQGMTFSNGSTATGSFYFDIDTNTFSGISISVTAATDYTDFQAQTFDAIAPTSGNYYGAIFTTLPLSFNDIPACDSNSPYQQSSTCGTNGIVIGIYPSQMTDAGGTITASYSYLVYCSGNECNNGSWAFQSLTSNLTTGSITSVPEAETYAMMLAGLGLVGWTARRRRQVH